MLGLSIAEYAPNKVKKTVVGAGHGDKGQVRAMVKCLLPRAAPDSADAADALAIAITHAHSRSWAALEARGGARARKGAAMIGKLTGRLDTVSLSAVIVDVAGVGYEVTVGARTLSMLPPVGETVTLAIETHMREDAIRLYGFATEHERAWFRALQTVQGVGAKVALAVLGTLSASELANAVALQDKGMVARAPGVGPKVAARIVAELKDKMPSARARDQARLAVLAPVALLARRRLRRATRFRRSPISAMATARPLPRCRLPIGKAGREARAEELIRLGLKELAQ